MSLAACSLLASALSAGGCAEVEEPTRTIEQAGTGIQAIEIFRLREQFRSSSKVSFERESGPYQSPDPVIEYYPLFPTTRRRPAPYMIGGCNTSTDCKNASSDFPFKSKCGVSAGYCFVEAPGTRTWSCKERSAKLDAPHVATPLTYAFSRTQRAGVLANQGTGPGKVFMWSGEVNELVGFPEPDVGGGIVTYDVLHSDRYSGTLVLERVALVATATLDAADKAAFDLLSRQHQSALSVPGGLALSYAVCDRFTDGP
ncbi:MAG TPA: hypothetical protein VM925_37805 [Labilithrix sp.]|nr:hypothetical protein [Labilithrix sp.]